MPDCFLAIMEGVMRVIIAVPLMLSGYAYTDCDSTGDSDLRHACHAQTGHGRFGCGCDLRE